MSNHKTLIGKLLAFDFTSVWQEIKGWFKNAWEDADHKVLDTAVNITEVIKNALGSNLAATLVLYTTTKVDDEVLAFMYKNISIILADEFLIKGVTPDSTPEDLRKVANDIVDSFGGMSNKDKQQLYTSIAANIYRLWQEVKAGKQITFGTAAALVESAFQKS